MGAGTAGHYGAPGGMQHEEHRIVYETFLPEMFNVNLIDPRSGFSRGTPFITFAKLTKISRIFSLCGVFWPGAIVHETKIS